MAEWNAKLYLKFASERTRPAQELLARIPLENARRVIDLGCGPGNSTGLLAARWPDAQVTGIDSSPNMLREARAGLPNLSFEQADIASWSAPADADVLFANAVFQWVPDQIVHLKRLLCSLGAGGALAVQMPDNLGEPSHVAMREIASAADFAGKLSDVTKVRHPLPDPGVYYDALKPLCASFDIWHTYYYHVIDGIHDVVEWMKGTGLRIFLDPLEERERDQFLNAYTELMARVYPVHADGKVLLRYPRLFFVAVR
ncbi:MAG: trans-aconitate 2-methyltransferase [Xanthobacteraceae bacterium]|nr:trans-aconitate 2-methyltransferase [Xanthobacteraceae bacterium]